MAFLLCGPVAAVSALCSGVLALVHRIDDFVGSHIAPAAIFVHSLNNPLPSNQPIGPGGHTGYWRQQGVFEHPSLKTNRGLWKQIPFRVDSGKEMTTMPAYDAKSLDLPIPK